MATAYSYIRMSTSEQLKGDSLRRQLHKFREYCEKHGFEPDESLRDIGVSAYRGRNRMKGALGEFLRMVEEGAIEPGSHLVVESLDRLSREAVNEAMPTLLNIVNAGVIVDTLLDGMTYEAKKLAKDPTPLVVGIMVQWRAQNESNEKAKRVREAIRAKQLRAHEVLISKDCPSWMRYNGRAEMGARTRDCFTLIDKKVEALRLIYTLAAEDLGLHAILKQLVRRKFPPMGGTRSPRGQSLGKAPQWRVASIARWLRDDAVLGTLTMTTRDPETGQKLEVARVENYYPAALDAELVRQARRTFEERAARGRTIGAGRRGAGFNNLFHGIATCACGSAMNYRSKPPSKKYARAALLCGRRANGHECDHQRHFPYEVFERAFLESVVEIDLERLIGKRGAKLKRLKDELAELEHRLDEVRIAIKRAHGMIFAADVPLSAEAGRQLRADLNARTAAAGELEAAAKAKRVEIRRALEHSPKQHQERIGQLNTLMQSASDLDRYRLRSQLAQEIKKVVPEITFQGNGLALVWLATGENKFYAIDGPRWYDLSEGHPNTKRFRIVLTGTAGTKSTQ